MASSPAPLSTSMRAASVSSMDLPDRRVCWICYTDETLDDRARQDPHEKPNASRALPADVRWVRPCRCTGSLHDVHERCLLRWRDTQLASNSSAGTNAPLRCPACKTPYNFDEPSDVVLETLNFVDRSISQAAPYLTISLAFISLYIVLLSHGAYSLTAFMGPRASARILMPPSPGRPSSWRLWTGLPMIPAALIASRLEGFEMWLLAAPWACVENVHEDVVRGLRRWPPSEQGVIVLAPWVRLVYKHLYRRLIRSMFPTPQTEPAEPALAIANNAAPAVADDAAAADNGAAADDEAAAAGAGGDQPAPARAENAPTPAVRRRSPARVLAGALFAPSIASACGAALGWCVKTLRSVLDVASPPAAAGGLPYPPFPAIPPQLAMETVVNGSWTNTVESVLTSLDMLPTFHKNILGLSIGIFLRDVVGIVWRSKDEKQRRQLRVLDWTEESVSVI
ncbi:hypothetical protein M427DRAFT_67805 [Gonapodya prolifera JEL478]|uniref:RING-CH-type domain-containing protein n=1 Tax=Gonapodya prolifera (strain JEL478) TaxID=1344416 RepID=A0A139ANQ8_GONPJ|nr:hypothetical protein M427DRAFT_67805 [Gonapodya prolifera JEL478]|eukprot:KXS18376.1 hypothetical protein M427DRAFT_67805 [Gonapodya prolifera JEL478]